jgi:hypothetical protein
MKFQPVEIFRRLLGAESPGLDEITKEWGHTKNKQPANEKTAEARVRLAFQACPGSCPSDRIVITP